MVNGALATGKGAVDAVPVAIGDRAVAEAAVPDDAIAATIDGTGADAMPGNVVDVGAVSGAVCATGRRSMVAMRFAGVSVSSGFGPSAVGPGTGTSARVGRASRLRGDATARAAVACAVPGMVAAALAECRFSGCGSATIFASMFTGTGIAGARVRKPRSSAHTPAMCSATTLALTVRMRTRRFMKSASWRNRPRRNRRGLHHG